MSDPAKMEKSHSAPDVHSSGASSEMDIQRVMSLSLSRLRKHTDLADYHHKPSPFHIRWMHGYNSKVGVINLNNNGSTVVFYAASNCGVLYNWTTNQMRILQGHRHMVEFIGTDVQGKWLVTADSGPENIIIIWDACDYFPQKTIFLPHKLSKVALSPDAKYLLTLGYQEKALISWWIWSFGFNEPHAKLDVDVPRDSIVAMDFNPFRSQQFVLMTKQDIWIGVSGKIFVMERGLIKETDNYELKIRKPEKNFNPELGKLTCFTFVRDTSQILVATNRGAVLIYGYTIEYQENVDGSNYQNLKFIKALKIEKHKINVIKSIDGFVVTGNNAGEINFYDDQMKLLYWVHGFQVDNVKGLGFNISPRSYMILDPKCKKICPCWEQVEVDKDPETGIFRQKLLKKKIPSDATTKEKPIIVRDFIVCTNNQGVGFVDFVVEKIHTILDTKPSNILSLSVHPEKPFLCLGYANGIVELYNFVQHRVFTRLDLREYYKVVIPPKNDSINCDYEITIPEVFASCIKYSLSGLHLVCGLNTGEIIFLDPVTIRMLIDKTYKDTSHAIKEINFTCDSLTMAFSDTGRTVGMYKYDCSRFVWTFIGKHRAHYKDISALFFLPEKNDDGEYKLLSLGSDRIMVEYDIGSSSNERLEVFSLDRMDQVPIPLAGISWPIPKDLDPNDCKGIPTILVANDEFKYKILNYATTMTMATVLGPRYDHPVNRMQLVSRHENGEEQQYLLFATKNIIGLQKMPLDGNPWKHVGMLGHPIQLTGMCFREDSGTLFTIGSKDSIMCQWAANYRSVDLTAKQGGGELDPYYCLIENGRPGWLFQEIRDLFYYIQILCQGTFSPAVRRVKDFIPVDSLPDLMRALGFFPTEYEVNFKIHKISAPTTTVENLIVEAKYKVYQRLPSIEIGFEEFVKLYLNHRPAFGDNFTRMRSAFRHFATFDNISYLISREDFIDMLSSYGECFSRPLSWYLLSILYGHSFEDRSAMNENDFTFLPEEISFSEFVTNIFGIQENDNASEQTVKSSYSSHITSSMDSADKSS